jgi:tetratricopeptide (TPR) repeat protein
MRPQRARITNEKVFSKARCPLPVTGERDKSVISCLVQRLFEHLMKLPRLLPPCFLFLLCLFAYGANAQDPSIDRLLKKLPPPEKLVKPSVERAVKQPDPALRDPLVDQIEAAANSNNLTRGLTLSRQLSAKYPNSGGTECLHGILALMARQEAEAAKALRHAVALRPDFSLAYFGLASIEVEHGRYGGAVSHLRQLTRLEPQYAFGWMALSDCALRSGNKRESLEAARRATSLSPSSADAWLQLARAETASGHAEATLTALTRGAEVSPDSASILATVGFGYINLNRIRQAIPPLQRAARLAPKDFLVRAQLGYCLQDSGQVDAGIRELRAAADMAPSTYAPVWEHLGIAYQKKGMHRDAVKAFERAVRAAPAYGQAWRHLADEYRALGQVAQANQAAARAQSLPGGRTSPKKR